ncbi:MAG: PAS domain S-box protein [Gemmatimonadetes bacterium]|uniref:histidine kinase n=1 Tax=Candidatus Kutchimonas denitrificans TaxID=3056748 RepID=A0AAE5C8C2_9BACT|nr:PAS domain S-box protein [Gemmatimonadota bacterium]NIR74356.1 PAS domain S-box protein [Candidatus Kutchimonas denitrificans]NIS02607.1 PAS domain S-box protein [Gemmatimonadota bacterium]NIT68482.1 PAS domain S-box protein [Gemmatimonadota bacterium]NIU51959.1 PAS domain S-box protein [Gemmatimonadota bacterium]
MFEERDVAGAGVGGAGEVMIPGTRKRVPLRALVYSAMALGTAIWGSLSHPTILAGYDALSWLLILIPAFALAYYRGWTGALQVLSGGAVVLLAVELAAEWLLPATVDWVLLFFTSVILVGAGLGIGLVTEALHRERNQALFLAYSDPLTGMPNRRLLDFVLGKELEAARRGRPLGIVLFRVDELRRHNERHGRRVGDELLRRVGTCLSAQLRRMDVAGRYESARFLTILSGEDLDGAWVHADRVRDAVAKLDVGDGISCTVSAGVAAYAPWMDGREDLLAAARDGLRRARESGGNRVSSAMADSEPAELQGFGELDPAKQEAVERDLRFRSLEEAEIRYRHLFDGVPVGLYRSTPSGRVLDANQGLVDLLGYPDRETLLSRNASEFYAEPDERLPWLERVSDDGVVTDYEVELRRFDGGRIWARDSCRAVRGREGRIKYYQGALLDITGRMRAQEELAAANAKLRAVIDAAPLAVVSLDDQGRVTSWNPAAERMFGWSESEVLGKLAPFVSPARELEFHELRQRVLRGDLISGIETQRQRRDGSQIDLTLWAAPLATAGGETEIIGLMVNITEEKAAEQARRLLATVVEQGAEAIVVTDVEGIIQYVNPAFERVTGYSPDEVLGKNPRILSSGRHEPEFYRELWDTLLRGEVWAGRLQNRRKDGSLFQQEGTIAPVRDVAGRVVNYVSVARDVTREAELEEQLRQAQKMEALGQLAGGVAHDFNNVLTAIIANSEMLVGDLEAAGQPTVLAEEIKAAGGRAAALTRQLLTFSRRQVLQPELVDLSVTIDGVTQLIGRLIGDEVELELSLARDLGRVRIDRGQLEQVVVNLAVNARDAMPEGGKLIIETSNTEVEEAEAGSQDLACSGPHVLLAMTDTGTGMDTDTRTRIFEPFFTTKPKGKGTGLGLSTAYGIVKQSGGFIRVYSEPGRGTTFRIYLPRVSETSEPGVAFTREPELKASHGESVLVVDDDDSVRIAACRVLGDAGYRTFEAEGPLQALDLIERCDAAIDLMITDLVMPDLDGEQLAQRVARLSPRTRIIFVSGYSEKTLESDLLRSGVPFLSKPFCNKALLRKVAEVLQAERTT